MFVQLGPLLIAQTLHVRLGHVLTHSLSVEGLLITPCAPLGLYKGVIHSSFSSSNNHTQPAILCMSAISYYKFRQKYLGAAVISGREVDLVCDFGYMCHTLAVPVLGCDTVIWQICTRVCPKCWYHWQTMWCLIQMTTNIETKYKVQNLDKLVLLDEKELTDLCGTHRLIVVFTQGYHWPMLHHFFNSILIILSSLCLVLAVLLSHRTRQPGLC